MNVPRNAYTRLKLLNFFTKYENYFHQNKYLQILYIYIKNLGASCKGTCLFDNADAWWANILRYLYF